MALIKVKERGRDTVNLGHRNILINGAMRVHQRGSTGQPVGGYGYGCDRWRGYNNGTARYDVVQESITDLAQFNSCYKLTVTTAQSSYGTDISVPIEQAIEGTNSARLSFGTSNAQTITVSFYVKSSVTGDFACALFNGSPITRSIVQNWTVNSANTWERKTLTFAGDTSGTWRTDNLVGMYIALASIGGSSGTARASAANTWEAGYKNHLADSDNIFATNSATMRFTGIQIEVGDTATDFEHRSYGEEFMLCRRYTQVLMGDENYSQIGGTGIAVGSGFVDYPITLVPKMRIRGTVSLSGTVQVSNASSGFACSAVGVITQQSSSDVYSLRATTSGVTPGAAYRLESANNTTARLIISAEL